MKTNYARNLPHIQPIGATFFITFSLYGSIPKEKIQQLQQERNAKINILKDENSQNLKENLDIAQKRYFQRVDAVLDSVEYGEKHLENPQVAQIVANKIHQYDNEYYDLLAFCIMPNHVHLLFDLNLQSEKIPIEEEVTDKNYKQIYDIMHLIKGGSAYEANKILNRSGRLWQVESYDRYVRNIREFQNIVMYVANNPKKAGLVNHWRDFPFTYIRDDYQYLLP
jgi:putative transposase